MDRRMIMGIDPGIANTGWALIESDGDNHELLDHGTVKTKAKTPTANRIEIIADDISERLDGISIVGIEKVFFSGNISSAIPVAQVIGAIMWEARRQDKQVFEVTPQETKMTLGLKGNAKKSEVIAVVKDRFGPKMNQHVADAVSIAICAINKATGDR